MQPALVRTAPGAAIAIRMNVGALPVPDTSFSANDVRVWRRARAFELTFSQIAPRSNRAFAALVVSIAEDAVIECINRAPEALQVLNRMADERKVPRIASTSSDDVRSDLPENQCALEHASVMSYNFLGDDADVLFWRMSPSAYQALQPQMTAETTSLDAPGIVEGVAAVRLSLASLVELFDKLRLMLGRPITE